MLETTGLSKHFGAFEVTRGVNLSLPKGARHALIGPNGAGKSTLVNLLTGILRPSAGTVRLAGQDITRLRPDERVARGLVRTFQINTLFPDLTPLEAVSLAIVQKRGKGGHLLRSIRRNRQEIEEAAALLGRLGLLSDAMRSTRDLPYGRQRLLEIALALAAEPAVLLLDEPAAGVPPRESAELFEVIAGLPSDVAVLFIEHDMELVFRFAQRITVLVAGAIIREGAPDDIARDPEVRRVYLGSETSHRHTAPGQTTPGETTPGETAPAGVAVAHG